MNNINITEFKTDYLNCMLAEDMMTKYNINKYYFIKLRKLLNLNRGAVEKLDYILKINAVEPVKPNEEPVKPNEEPVKPNEEPVKPNITKPKIPTNKPKIPKPKIPKSTINIKTINTDDEINITEIKKCDTTYNNDKSELFKMLNKTEETLKKSKQVLNKKK